MIEQWTETKKEFEIDNQGKEVLKKVTKERDILYWKRSKEHWYFIFQIITTTGVIIIFVGLIANFVLQNRLNKFQLKQQRAQFEIGIYSRAINLMDRVIFCNTDSESMQSTNAIFNDITPNLILLNNHEIVDLISDFDSVLVLQQLICIYRDTVSSENSLILDFYKYYHTHPLINDSIVKDEDWDVYYRIEQRLYLSTKYYKNLNDYWDNYRMSILNVLKSTYPQNYDSVYNICKMYFNTQWDTSEACFDNLANGLNRKILGNSVFLSFWHHTDYIARHDQDINESLLLLDNHLKDRMIEIRKHLIIAMQKSNSVLN